MKNTLLLISLLCLFNIAYTAPLVLKGYVIVPGGDTLRCKIKFGGFGNTNYQRVVTVSDSGEEKVYNGRQKEILGYGITEGVSVGHYLFFEGRSTGESTFFKRMIDGPGYQLYYILESSGTGPIVNTTPKYVMVNPQGAYEMFGICTICGWRKRMSLLLADDPEALEALEKINAREIPEFVRSVNNKKSGR